MKYKNYRLIIGFLSIILLGTLLFFAIRLFSQESVLASAQVIEDAAITHVNDLMVLDRINTVEVRLATRGQVGLAKECSNLLFRIQLYFQTQEYYQTFCNPSMPFWIAKINGEDDGSLLDYYMLFNGQGRLLNAGTIRFKEWKPLFEK